MTLDKFENMMAESVAPTAEPDRQYYFIEQAKAWMAEQKERLGRALTACVVTFGCQMNARDSEKLVGHFGKYRLYDG